MNKRDLLEYATAHRNCQIITNILEQLEILNPVATEATEDIDKMINKLREIRNSEVNHWIDLKINKEEL